MSHASWDEQTTLYQIYPRSFYDSNGDGVGDLQGIIKKLDYLKGDPGSLGVDVIWLSPFYTSPMADFGYDIVDHCNVDPLFGTLQDFDELIQVAHRRGIKVLIDFVPNHTSHLHPWFLESKASKDNIKRDWYIWQEAKPNGAPPNNWLSAFGGSAWQFDETTQQYYLHTFLKEQPDLNWHNPQVRKAMKEIIKFWLERGVDGFRMDAVYWLSKDVKYRDDPPNLTGTALSLDEYDSLLHTHSRGGALLFDYLKELSKTAKKYGDKLLITEAYPETRADFNEYINFYKKVDPDILVPFNFEGIFLPWDAQAFKRSIDGFQSRLQANYMPVYAMGNHDASRIATRFGNEAARLIAILLMSLPGLPVLYYGDELGMHDGVIAQRAHQDPLVDSPGRRNRDPERTPMPWTPSTFAGFSKILPWLPLGSHKTVNVQTERARKHSLWQLYRSLLELRRHSKVLKRGAYEPLESGHQDIFAFRRTFGEERLEIVLNFSKTHSLPYATSGKIVISTKSKGQSSQDLSPLEGRIIIPS